MKFKKKYKNIVFSHNDYDTTSKYVNKIKERNYHVRSACNGMDVLGILMYSSINYDLALLELDVLVEPLKDMNRENPIMFPSCCEEKDLADLVKIIKNHNKGIKVVGFSELKKKEYASFYDPFKMKKGMDKYILEEELNTYIQNGFNL